MIMVGIFVMVASGNGDCGGDGGIGDGYDSVIMRAVMVMLVSGGCNY